MSKSIGKVEQLTGKANIVSPDGESSPAVAGMEIAADSVVTTEAGSAMIIRFSDGTTMNIGADEFVLIDKTVSDSEELAQDETQAEVDSLKAILAESPDLSVFEETASGEAVAVGGSSIIVDSIEKHNANHGDSGSSSLDQFASNKITPLADDDDQFGLVTDTSAASVTLNNVLTNDNTPTITGTISDPTANVVISVGGNDYTAINNGDGTWTLPETSPLPDGTTEIVVVATDPAGNETTETAEITVDTVDPIVTIDPMNTSDSTPVITGTTDDDTAAIVVTIGGEEQTATNNGDGTWTLPVTNPLPEGDTVITVVATDPAGNSTTETETIIIDSTPPSLQIDPVNTNDTTPTISGTTDDTTATIVVTIDGKDLTATNNGNGTWNLELTEDLPEGGTPITVIATDPLGNSTTETAVVIIDTTYGDGNTDNTPTVTITEDTNNDGVINATELDGTIGVEIKIPPEAAVGDVITVTDGTTPQTIIITAALITAGEATTSFDAPVEGETITITATVTDSDGNTLESSDSATIDTKYGTGGDTTPGNIPTVTITEDANNDGVINATELDGQIDVNIKIPAEAVAGEFISVTDGITTIDVEITDALITDGSTTVSFDTPAEGETITVTATVTDTDGNTLQSTDSATVDTQYGDNGSSNTDNVPTVTITADANDDGIINQTELNGSTTINANIKIPVEAAVGDTIYVSDGTTTQVITITADLITDGSTTVNFDTPAEGETITITATVIDNDGNTLESSDSATVDTQYGNNGSNNADNIPTVTITADTDNDGFINKTELNGSTTLDVEINIPAEAVAGEFISVTDGTTTIDVEITDALITDGSTTVSFDTPAEGETITVTATVTDADGNTLQAADSATVDTIADNGDGVTPATITLDTISEDGYINAQESGNLLTISGDSNVIGATVVITMDNTVLGKFDFATATVQSDGTYSIIVDTTTMATFDDNIYTMQASIVTDDAGNTVYSTSQDVVLDTNFANVTIDALANIYDTGTIEDFITTETALVFTGTYDAEAGDSNLIVKVDSTIYDTSNGLVVDTVNNTWSLDLTGTPFSEGLFDISAIVTDIAGNSTTVNQSLQIVDPSVGIQLDPISGNFINLEETLEGIVITGTSNEIGNEVTFTLDGNPLDIGTPVIVEADGTFTLNIPAETFTTYADKTYTVTASVNDLVSGVPYTDTEDVILDTSNSDNNGTGTGIGGSDATITLDAVSDGYINQQEADNGILITGTTTAVEGTPITFIFETTTGDQYPVTTTSNGLPITAGPDGTFSAFISLGDLTGVDNTTILITAEVIADKAGNISSSDPVGVIVDLSAGTLVDDAPATPVYESGLENGSIPSLDNRTASGNLLANDTNVANSTIASVNFNGVEATVSSENSNMLILDTNSGIINIAINDTNYNGIDYLAGDYVYTLETTSTTTQEIISYTVSDAAGNVSNTANLTISIIDGDPVAYDNVDTIIASNGNTTAGNVITDEYNGQTDLIDGETTLSSITYDSTVYTFSGETLTINAEFGDITFNQDGSYDYTYNGIDSVQTGGNRVDLWENVGVYAFQNDDYLNSGKLDPTTLASHTGDVSENDLGLGVSDSGWFSSDSINGDDALILEFSDNISEVKLNINDVSFFNFFAGTTVSIYDENGVLLDTQGNTHFISFFGSANDTYQIDMGDIDFKYIVIESTSKVFLDEISYTPSSTTTTDVTETFTYEITDADGDTSTANLIIDGNNNTILYDSNALLQDGGLGIDTLILNPIDNLDFSTISNLQNMEIIDLSGGDHAITNLDVADIINMTDADNVLTIYGDSGDSVSKPTGTPETWTQTDTGVDDGNGHTVDVYNVSDGVNTVTVNIEQEIIVS